MWTCIFCLNNCDENCTPSNESASIFPLKTEPPDKIKDFKQTDILERFFNFLERYLSNDGKDKPRSSNKAQKACEDCLKIVKAFCDLYHDLKTIQLLLNWQLYTLKDIMITAKRSPAEQDKAQVSDAADAMDDSFRTELIENVARKLTSSYPKLTLKKLPSSAYGSRERQTEAVEDNLDLVPESYLNPSSPKVIGEMITPEEAEDDVEANSPEPPVESKSLDETGNEVENDIKIKQDGSDDFMENNVENTGRNQRLENGRKMRTKPKKDNTRIIVKLAKCSFCGKSVGTDKYLRKHILARHPEKWDSTLFKYKRQGSHRYRYKCPGLDCEKIFKQIHSFQMHWRKCHSESNSLPDSNLTLDIQAFSVDPDSKLFKNVYSKKMSKHFAKIEVPLRNEVRICQIETCKRCFHSEEDFEAHKNMHGSFTCALCPVSKEYLPDLAVHEVDAHSIGEDRRCVKCRRCDLQFTEFQGYLRHHVTVHFSLKFVEQSCPICRFYLVNYESKAKSSVTLFTHLKEAHDLTGKVEKEIHRCIEPDCTAYFLTIHGLTLHHRLEHEMDKDKLDSLKKSVCEECGKVFHQKEKFRVHLLSHSGPSSWQFVCETCSKKCMTKGKLEEHMRTHTKEKPFVCQVCGAAYGHRHNLRIHVNNKHGDVVQDVAKKVDKPNLTSRKGVKRNPEVAGGDKCVRNKRKRRRKIISRDVMDASESDQDNN